MKERDFWEIVSVVIILLCLGHFIGCLPRGTEADFAVRVGADTCQEDRSALPVQNELVTLNCARVEGEGRIRIRFPRRAWWDISHRQAGQTDEVGK